MIFGGRRPGRSVPCRAGRGPPPPTCTPVIFTIIPGFTPSASSGTRTTRRPPPAGRLRAARAVGDHVANRTAARPVGDIAGVDDPAEALVEGGRRRRVRVDRAGVGQDGRCPLWVRTVMMSLTRAGALSSVGHQLDRDRQDRRACRTGPGWTEHGPAPSTGTGPRTARSPQRPRTPAPRSPPDLRLAFDLHRFDAGQLQGDGR